MSLRTNFSASFSSAFFFVRTRTRTLPTLHLVKRTRTFTMMRFQVTPHITNVLQTTLTDDASGLTDKQKQRFKQYLANKDNGIPLAALQELVEHLNQHTKKNDEKMWVHQLLEGSEMITSLETTEDSPSSNHSNKDKEYKERMETLKKTLDNKRYAKMVQSVTGGVSAADDEDEEEEMKGKSEMQKHKHYLSLGTNLLVSMVTSFAAGYFIVSRGYSQTAVCDRVTMRTHRMCVCVCTCGVVCEALCARACAYVVLIVNRCLGMMFPCVSMRGRTERITCSARV